MSRSPYLYDKLQIISGPIRIGHFVPDSAMEDKSSSFPVIYTIRSGSIFPLLVDRQPADYFNLFAAIGTR